MWSFSSYSYQGLQMKRMSTGVCFGEGHGGGGKSPMASWTLGGGSEPQSKHYLSSSAFGGVHFSCRNKTQPEIPGHSGVLLSRWWHGWDHLNFDKPGSELGHPE